MVLMKERLQCRPTGMLKLLYCRPANEEVAPGTGFERCIVFAQISLHASGTRLSPWRSTSQKWMRRL
jgi:hypothetical protein